MNAKNLPLIVFLFGAVATSAQCTQKASLTQEEFSRPACFVIGTKAYMTCSSLQGKKSLSTFMYNQSTDSWTKETDHPGPPRESAGAFALYNKGYVIGGLSDTSGIYYTDLKEYDPLTKTWSARASFPGKGRSGAFTFALGNYGYMGTGINLNGDKVGNDFWRYDPLADSWTQLPDVPGSPRQSASVFILNGKAYVGFGFESEYPYAPLDDFYVFDPATSSWSMLQNKTFTGYYPDNFSVANTGFLHNAALGFYKYLPATDSWQAIPNCNKSSQATFAIGNKGYFAFGLSNGTQTNELWEYNTGLIITDLLEKNKKDPDVFPNPIADRFTIDSEAIPASLNLYDQTGRLICACVNSRSMETSRLVSGCYLLVVRFQNDEIYYKKLIK